MNDNMVHGIPAGIIDYYYEFTIYHPSRNAWIGTRYYSDGTYVPVNIPDYSGVIVNNRFDLYSLYW